MILYLSCYCFVALCLLLLYLRCGGVFGGVRSSGVVRSSSLGSGELCSAGASAALTILVQRQGQATEVQSKFVRMFHQSAHPSCGAAVSVLFGTSQASWSESARGKVAATGAAFGARFGKVVLTSMPVGHHP